MASSQVDPIFPEGHISYEVRQGRPEHRALSTRTFIPRVVLFLAQKLFPNVPGPFKRVWIRIGVSSRKADHQWQPDPCNGGAMESTDMHLLVPVGRDDRS